MKKNKRFLLIVSFAAAILFVAAGLNSVFRSAGYIDKLTGQFQSVEAAENVDTSIYLPIILKQYPLPPTVFGMQMGSINESGGLSKVVEAQVDWVGGAVVSWSAVEPNLGDRNWSSLASTEQQWINATTNGMIPIANVRSTPNWAQLYPAYSCGPMKQEYFDEFASFMYDLVTRYSASPYNIKYWEIWNEPDIDHSLVPPDSPYGCWGDISDPYYGGGYYADMLKVVYPQIKAANPNAQVLVGGLLLDCDPVNPPAGLNCTPSKYLEGILNNGGGEYFDGVSFHAYEYYAGDLGKYGNSNWHSAWNTTGPVLIAKSEYLKNLLENYGLTDKYLINTESALLCDNCVNDNTFETTKAYYVVQSYVTAIASELRGNLWYSLLGWRNSGLIDGSHAPLLGFDAYKFARQELDSATSLGAIGSTDINDPTGILGYKFDRGDRQVWVLWSLDGNPHTITLTPGTPAAIYDALGNPQTTSNTIDVGLNPLYLEW